MAKDWYINIKNTLIGRPATPNVIEKETEDATNYGVSNDCGTFKSVLHEEQVAFAKNMNVYRDNHELIAEHYEHMSHYPLYSDSRYDKFDFVDKKGEPAAMFISSKSNSVVTVIKDYNEYRLNTGYRLSDILTIKQNSKHIKLINGKGAFNMFFEDEGSASEFKKFAIECMNHDLDKLESDSHVLPCVSKTKGEGKILVNKLTGDLVVRFNRDEFDQHFSRSLDIEKTTIKDNIFAATGSGQEKLFFELKQNSGISIIKKTQTKYSEKILKEALVTCEGTDSKGDVVKFAILSRRGNCFSMDDFYVIKNDIATKVYCDGPTKRNWPTVRLYSNKYKSITFDDNDSEIEYILNGMSSITNPYFE